MRKNPAHPFEVFKLQSSFELCDIIKALCEEPLNRGEQGRGGLGVSYADMVALLKQMCEKDAVRVGLRVGPLPKFD